MKHRPTEYCIAMTKANRECNNLAKKGRYCTQHANILIRWGKDPYTDEYPTTRR